MKFHIYFFLLTIAVLLTTCQSTSESHEEQSGAGLAMDDWAMARSFPDGKIYSRNISQAFNQIQEEVSFREDLANWEALGPKNIGGRTLCVAFHPTEENTLYVGSASGGLWKTTTEGVGVDAWERVPIGHPVLGVSTIAIDPVDPNTMYIGTGEVYNYTAAQPGIVSRLTRGSYGVGILKSIDGGNSWEKSLDWSLSELKGVWDIVINPLRTNTLFAATTEGVYRTYNGGEDWQQISAVAMAMDIEMHPSDTNMVMISYGAYLSPQAGVYKSTDGGNSFYLVNGIPSDYSGKTLLAFSPSSPSTLYASVADAFESIGIYKSTDSGDNWELINDSDVARYQGWFSHDVAIKPDNPNAIIAVGVDTWRSLNGGNTLLKISNWAAWDFGQVPVGGPEGPPNYVHADIHAAYYHPNDPEKIVLATDGGIFVSSDNGNSWEGRNGGYQTQQFYANFSNSTTNPNRAIGGMQDNSTAVYLGDDAWLRVIGGDGMSAAINPVDDQIMYGSYQNLNILRSNNGGFNFSIQLDIASADSELRSFVGPYELAPSNPSIIYAGAQRVHRSENDGDSWVATSSSFIDGDNPILTLAVAPDDPNFLYVSTWPLFGGNAKVFRSTNGGASWTQMNGLPNRVCMDIAFHPENNQIALAVFSGFGSDHVYKTEDGGVSWYPSGADLPDVPTNSIVFDPYQTDHVYIANDVGVFASLDGGTTWDSHINGLIDAVMAMHLSISPANQRLRVATHGNGVYETDLLEDVVSSTAEAISSKSLRVQHFPNPVDQQGTLQLQLQEQAQLSIQLYRLDGALIKDIFNGTLPQGPHTIAVLFDKIPPGVYLYQISGQLKNSAQRINISRRWIRQ